MYKIDNKNLRAKIKNLFLKTMVCFSGCLMSSASLQKLFYGVCSALKCSFEEFVREKVVFPSYSSAIFFSGHNSFLKGKEKVLHRGQWLSLGRRLWKTQEWYIRAFGDSQVEGWCWSILWGKLKVPNEDMGQLPRDICITNFNMTVCLGWWNRGHLDDASIPSVGVVLGILTTEDEMVGWHHRLNGHEFE